MNLLKTWVLNWKWIREARNEAFGDAQKDILLTFDDDYLVPRAKKMYEDKLVSMLSSVDLRNIVSWDKQRGLIYIGGEKADEIRLSNLKAEVEFLLQSELWKILYETPKELAQRALFKEDGKLENQLLKGRAMLFLLDTQKNIIEVLKSYKKDENIGATR